MNELALFAGAGGGILGGQLLGWTTICAVERDTYAAQVLAQRQNDGLLPIFPIWSDVCSFDGKPWRGIVDVISGGFPCQDISTAGKGLGLDGARSGLWSEFKRIIGEVRPNIAFIENSPMLVVRGLDRILCDLAELGFHAIWGVFRASSVGAAHHRARFFLVAYTDRKYLASMGFQESIVINTKKSRRRQLARAINAALPADDYTRMPRNIDDVAAGMDRLKATGNGQVPGVAARAFRILGGAA